MKLVGLIVQPNQLRAYDNLHIIVSIVSLVVLKCLKYSYCLNLFETRSELVNCCCTKFCIIVLNSLLIIVLYSRIIIEILFYHKSGYLKRIIADIAFTANNVIVYYITRILRSILHMKWKGLRTQPCSGECVIPRVRNCFTIRVLYRLY